MLDGARQDPRTASTAVRCREITAADLDGVIDLLTVGFHRHRRVFWATVIDRLTQHHTPAGFPKYGFMLESDGVPVGVLLLIYTKRTIDGVGTIWCNESSHYVDPRFRPFASVLVKRLRRYKDVTYLNVTTAAHRASILEVQGYKRLAQGVYLAVPLLSWPRCKARVYPMATAFSERLEAFDSELLTKHASYGGCISLVCEHEGRSISLRLCHTPQVLSAVRLSHLQQEPERLCQVCRTHRSLSGQTRHPPGGTRCRSPSCWHPRQDDKAAAQVLEWTDTSTTGRPCVHRDTHVWGHLVGLVDRVPFGW